MPAERDAERAGRTVAIRTIRVKRSKNAERESAATFAKASMLHARSTCAFWRSMSTVRDIIETKTFGVLAMCQAGADALALVSLSSLSV